MKQHTSIALDHGQKETVQMRLSGWIWRQTKAHAATRVPNVHPGDIVAEALVAYLGLKEEPAERKQRRAS